MERWEIDQLDKISEGDVALKIFHVQKQLSVVEKQRADASQKVSDARNILDFAEHEFRAACAEERDYLRALNALKKYLNDRLGKDSV